MEHRPATLPILDVRCEDPFQQGHAAGSVNIPADELDERMYELPEKGACVWVFHDDVNVLDQAMGLLRERGYQAQAANEAPLNERGPSRTRLWSPTPLLVEASKLSPAPGRAADLGCGSGREAVHLAMHGWHVDAYDILPDALLNAGRLASRNDVTLNLIAQDLRHYPAIGDQKYDLVCMFRFWNEAAFASAIRALRPDGLLVVEAFASGDPKRATKLITTNGLRERASSLDVVSLRETDRSGRRFLQLIARGV